MSGDGQPGLDGRYALCYPALVEWQVAYIGRAAILKLRCECNNCPVCQNVVLMQMLDTLPTAVEQRHLALYIFSDILEDYRLYMACPKAQLQHKEKI